MLTLVSGTVVAQAVVFIMTMVLARIFSTEDFGQFARYTSIVSIIVVVAALRYDMTIMLPKKEAWALACARLGMVCITAVSLAASLVALARRTWSARPSRSRTASAPPTRTSPCAC